MVEVEAIKDRKLIDKMKRTLQGRDNCLFIMGINVGLRISDLLDLKIGDVLDKDTVTIKEEKTGKARTFQVNKAAQAAIRDYVGTLKDYKSNWYLFQSRKGENKPITRIAAWQTLNNAALKCGIKSKVGTHTLSKTFGYWAYKQGIDVTLLQQIFNHSAPSITLRYIGITQDDINNVYLNLNL
jgi:site-specific recombinase XerD